ncbi:MAG TPA: hypothetical protein VFK38_10385 [Candidatus Limnocylindrales bacterium]|nr:hypothetical protein [Candidatus Limnocylindrales bacterium]
MTSRLRTFVPIALLTALVAAACSTGPGASASVNPSSVASQGADAFCQLDLATSADIKATVDSATTASTGGQVDKAQVAAQVDATLAQLKALQVSGSAVTARDAMVSALEAFKANPEGTTAQGVLTAHAALVQAQTAACGT